jgi:hypothetical protein
VVRIVADFRVPASKRNAYWQLRDRLLTSLRCEVLMTQAPHTPDADAHKGAVEQESRDQETNTSLGGQMQHRNKSPMADTLDTDFPEPGMSPEHTGQKGGPDAQGSRQINSNPQRDKREPNPEAENQDQDPGHRQKKNQGDKKDDSLVA